MGTNLNELLIKILQFAYKILVKCRLQKSRHVLTQLPLDQRGGHHTDNSFNTLRPRQNGRRYPDDFFKCIFLNENICIPINISLKFVPVGQINNIPSLVQIRAWRRPGDKPLFEPMMVSLVTHICVTRPQWVKSILWKGNIKILTTFPLNIMILS